MGRYKEMNVSGKTTTYRIDARLCSALTKLASVFGPKNRLVEAGILHIANLTDGERASLLREARSFTDDPKRTINPFPENQKKRPKLATH